MDRVQVFAPGSIGNVGPGLDILGLALTGRGDTLVAERSPGRSIVVRDPGHPDLPTDPERHTSAIAARAALRRGGPRGKFGLTLSLTKGLPLAGGQGGSAASAVVGAFAANTLMGSCLTPVEILEAALEAESAVAGRHLDNIAPSLLGGLILIRSLEPIDVIKVRVPRSLTVLLAKPSYRLETKRGRSVLPSRIDRGLALYQAAQVAAIVAGAAAGNLELIGRAIDDRIAEPVRAPLLPGFTEAKRAALMAGALGCSISGSGPTMFVLIRDRRAADPVTQAVQKAYRKAGFDTEIRLTSPDRRGARVLR